MDISIKSFVRLSATLAALCLNLWAQRPNVVIVITDDQGYGDLGCTGNPIIQTPEIDKLAGESVCLLDYHVAPTCSPTRAALMSGHWTNRTGAWHTIMGRSMLREDEGTLGEFFKGAGFISTKFWSLGFGSGLYFLLSDSHSLDCLTSCGSPLVSRASFQQGFSLVSALGFI